MGSQKDPKHSASWQSYYLDKSPIYMLLILLLMWILYYINKINIILLLSG